MNSLKISTLCLFSTGSFFSRPSKAWSLLSCEGLNLPSSLRNDGDLVQVEQGLVDDLVDLELVARQLLHRLEHFLGDDVLVGFAIVGFAEQLQLMRLRVVDRASACWFFQRSSRRFSCALSA